MCLPIPFFTSQEIQQFLFLRTVHQSSLALNKMSLAVSDSQFLGLLTTALMSEVLQFCLAYGADPHRDTEGVLPTEAAAAMGALQALAMLLRIGAVPGGKEVGQWK